MKNLIHCTTLLLVAAGQQFSFAQQTAPPPTRNLAEPPSRNASDPPTRQDDLVPGDRAVSSQDDQAGIFPEDDSPWFDNDDIRRELDLDENQIRRLNDAYGAARRQMRPEGENANNPATGLSDEARAQRRRELRDRFDDSFSRSSSNVFRDDQQRRRFNQLSLQRQGYSAFDNPRLQRELNFNDRQLRQLRDLNQNWNTELEGLRGTYAGDRSGTEQRFNQLRDRSRTGFEGILNDQQRTAFDEMVGNRFDFGADTYLGSRNAAQQNRADAGVGVGTQGGTGIGTQGGTGIGTQGGTGTGTQGGTGTGTQGGTSGGTGGTGGSN